jgi:excisionase family DNA binding protein
VPFPLIGGLTGPERGQRAMPRSQPADPTLESALLFAEEVATMVGMTRKWVYTETRAGRIPHVALGRYYRYRPDSIDAWLRQIEQRRA